MLYALNLDERAANAFTVFMTWLPRVVGALAVLLVGYILAKLLGGLLSRGLHRVGFDRILHGGQGGRFIQRAIGRPSGLAGTVAFWAILLGAVSLAASVLGIEALNDFVGTVWAYIPNVAAALLIF